MFEGIVLIVVLLVVIIVFLSFVPLGLWISALASGVHVSIFTLVGMRIRRVWPAKIVVPLIPMGKLIAPEDIAETVLFLSGKQAHMITGQVVKVSGGKSL